MVYFSLLTGHDIFNLEQYLLELSPETRSKFGPHGFDRKALEQLFVHETVYRGYLGFDKKNENLVAYAVLKQGYLSYDLPRLQSYGLTLDSLGDATIAPSVADAFQNKGVGHLLMEFVLNDLKSSGQIKRLILWGGVQKSNMKAFRLYQKNGFVVLGEFEYHGMNYDMIKCF